MKIYTAKPFLDNKTCDDVIAVLKSGMIAQGPKVKELENMFANYCQVKYCAAVSSGTAALHSALFAAGIKKDDEVITSPFTFVATANSILMQNAKPVFADIDERTFNINPIEIEKKITSKTKAIIPVHLYGLMADMDTINEIAKRNNLIVIEDACQAHGAEYRNLKAGSFGHLGTFSFYATKNMMSAEGGCVTSNNEEYIEKIKSFRHHGQSIKEQYNFLDFGYNYRMTDIHAVIGINQLERLIEFTNIRQHNAKLYDSELSGIEGIEIPYIPEGHTHVYHQYTIKIDSKKYGRTRDELIAELQKNEIYPGIFYPKSLHLFPPFRMMGYKEKDFPIAEKLSLKVLSLPVHPQIKNEDIIRIISIIKSYNC